MSTGLRRILLELHLEMSFPGELRYCFTIRVEIGIYWIEIRSKLGQNYIPFTVPQTAAYGVHVFELNYANECLRVD
ncbi:hypothetical protein M0802_000615 [Mischocyttarus mexicanus]|nr:hypothetical protein M0802_000615 [Mischocyttarus mexicanus]